MRYTRFGRTGLEVSRVSFGTFQFGGAWGEFERSDAVRLTRQAYEAGINFIDTAYAYGFGRAEQIVGEALAGPLATQRDEVVIATKGGVRVADDGTRVRDASPEWLRKGLEESLRNLGVDHTDVYLVHWPDPSVPAAETAGVVAEFIDEGKVRFPGVSNYTVAQMREFSETLSIDVVQPPYSLLRRGIEDELLPYCEQEDIGVFAYGTLAHGLLTGKYAPGAQFEGWRASSPLFQGEGFRRNSEMAHELVAYAGQLGVGVSELVTAWALAHPAVQCAIVGATNPGQLEGIVGTGDLELTASQAAEVEAIAASGSPIGGPSPEGGVPE